MPQLMRGQGIEEAKDAIMGQKRRTLGAVQHKTSAVVINKGFVDDDEETTSQPGGRHLQPDRPKSKRANRKGPAAASEVDEMEAGEPEKLHFFDAVFIPCFTNIVGTLLYLRMGYVAGQAGILVIHF